MTDNKIYSCGLYENEKEHLEKHFENSFSKFVHAAFKKDIELTKNNIKKNKFHDYATTMIMLGLGSIFLLFTESQNAFLAKLTTFLIGCFLIGYGLTDFILEKRYGRFFK